jgi:hypothetical protein
MDAILKAIEVEGAVDEDHRLHLDAPLPITGPSRVRVIILFPDQADMLDVDEGEWLHALARNPVFDFLNAPEEDIYTLDDGEPFQDPLALSVSCV